LSYSPLSPSGGFRLAKSVVNCKRAIPCPSSSAARAGPRNQHRQLLCT